MAKRFRCNSCGKELMETSLVSHKAKRITVAMPVTISETLRQGESATTYGGHTAVQADFCEACFICFLDEWKALLSHHRLTVLP